MKERLNKFERYARQILISGWGLSGQKKLAQAKVAIVGLGGIGSIATIFLAVAGIGKILIVDKDKVKLNNLNRQILHWEKDIGREKYKSAEDKLKKINSQIDIDSKGIKITEKNIDEIFSDVDAVVDALDNFQTRYLLNEFVFRKNIPLFHGPVHGFDGCVTTIIPGKTPCLRCIYSEIPPSKLFPVVGTTSGIVGIIQANEVLKYFTEIGELLTSEMIFYDGKNNSFTKLKLKKRKDCPLCS